MECSDDLQNKLCDKDCPLGFNKSETLLLVALMHKVKPFLKTDFYCDKMSNHLLMNVHIDTEQVPESDLVNAKIDLGLLEGTKKMNEGKSNKFNMEEYIANRMGLASRRGVVDTAGFSEFTSIQTCIALYSENQDVILDTMSKRLEFDKSIDWNFMRKACIPLWLKSESKLKALCE